MKLKGLRVTNFRSIEDSSVADEKLFQIDQITCLVGKNESGKTAVLQAISGLNPHPTTPFKYDRERDYPRRYLSRYRRRHPDTEAIVVSSQWELDNADREALAEIVGLEAITDNPVVVTRRYESSELEWTVQIDWKKATEYILSKSVLNAPEQSQLQKANTPDELYEILEKLKTLTDKQQLIKSVMDNYPSHSTYKKIIETLQSKIPYFMYFSNYDRMSGDVQLELLKQSLDDNSLNDEPELSGDKVFYEFLNYADLRLEDIINASTYESFTATLQSASNAITDEILPYWSQNPDLQVKVTVDAAKSGDKPPFNAGTIGRARIHNSLHRVDGPFGDRSAGFIWFFSFLIKFSQVKNEENPVILLLDEPGLSLHGKAQADLLRYIEEKLSPYHQIIYTTHSPFMVPPDKISSTRIVEDAVTVDSNNMRSPVGTKVREDVLTTDPDSVFPLQGALGYEITQTLFIGKNTILVEGPSDILYIKALSSALHKRARHGLSPRWVICPSGGIGNIRPFVSLFKGNEINIVVVSDYALGQKKSILTLKESNILRTGAMLTLNDFTGKSEADIEDLFEPSLYVDLLNKTYDLHDSRKITVEKLNAADTGTQRIVKKSEAYFRCLSPASPEFDHYSPADWLLSHPEFLAETRDDIDATLTRAEKLFESIDPFLSSGHT